MIRLTVLISGSGTNLQALIDACNSQTIPNACIIRVVSNRLAASTVSRALSPCTYYSHIPEGLVRAENANIPTRYHNLLNYKNRYPDNVSQARAEYDKDLAGILLEDHPHLVVCAGWYVFDCI